MSDVLTSENMLLGAALLDEGAAKELVGRLRAEDFAMEINRVLFDTMRSLDADGECVDAAKVANRSGVDRQYIMELMDIAPVRTDLEAHIAEVRRASMRRSLRQAAEEMIRAVAENEEPGEITGRAMEELRRIEEGNTGGLLTGTDAVLQFWERADSKNLYVKTGFPSLDRLLGGGLLNCGLYVLAARPGAGKTALAVQIGDRVAAREGAVLFISLEMEAVQLTARRISRASGVPSSKLLLGGATNEELTEAAKSGKRVAKAPFFVNNTLRCDVMSIRTLARQVKNLKLVIIDYLGLIQPDRTLKSRYEQITAISGELKVLARTLGVPVLCLAQLNRASEQRRDNTPMLSDLRDSGAIEQDADSVIFMHRPDMYNDGKKKPVVQVNVRVAKNRHAGTGDIQMLMQLQSGLFTELEERYG